LDSIAKEKTGILKNGIPVVAASGYPEVERVIAEKAHSLNAPLYQVGEAVQVKTVGTQASGNVVGLGFLDEPLREYRLSLPGDHQVQNAALAFGIVKVLNKIGFWNVSDKIIADGLASAVWPGRLERVHDDPVVLLDGGHNPDAFRALRDTVATIYRDKPIIGLVGIQNNRPIEEMAAIIGPSLKHVILTKVPESAIPASTERLAKAFADAGISHQVLESPDDALQAGMARAIQEDAILLVVGSFYLIGYLRPLLIKNHDEV
jgi:dihydrofolate synthase/folylpolyglutamate synthase